MLYRNLVQLMFSMLLAVSLVAVGCNSIDSGEEEEENRNTAFFNSGEIASGETFSYTFEGEETVDYYCEIHAPNMQGKVTVISSEDPSERDTVRMDNNQFIPGELSVAPNTEVVWINDQDHAHHVRSGNPDNDDGDDGGY